MGAYAVLAEAFRYPAPGRLERLRASVAELPVGPGRTGLEAFLDAVGRSSLEAWEELCTRTLDLELATAPYVGYQIWGDKYQRSPLLSELNVAMERAGVDLDGELPDHLVPVFRYLDRSAAPVASLLGVLEPALRALEKALAGADPENPYAHLVAGARRELKNLPAGGSAPDGRSPR
ncbi:MAG: nitrate reductase [Deltaproteobacteria bacterium]|nr:nitrate reductase [Deltaproteobacteria bacterium]